MEMVDPALGKVKEAIAKKDQDLFKKTYFELTKSCNDCHKLTNFQYNIVKVPDVSPFTNQDFNTKKQMNEETFKDKIVKLDDGIFEVEGLPVGEYDEQAVKD